jgi:hypothetical protein
VVDGFRDLIRVRTLLVAMTLLVCSVAATAQETPDDDVAPPPLKILSQSEKDKLGSENDVKRRTKLGLALMDSRMVQAEKFDSADDHDRMFVELGGFHALMDNMLDFLNKSDRDSRQVLHNFKRFEIGLRGFTPRLELIRRDLPLRYELYVRNLIKNLRAARAKAIEPLFDDTVVPQKKPE